MYDRILSGEMPPPKKKSPPAEADKRAVLNALKSGIIAAESSMRPSTEGRTRIRRLTRVEYEHTVRDLFSMPGIALKDDLPADGSAHGFDTNADALDLSHLSLIHI